MRIHRDFYDQPSLAEPFFALQRRVFRRFDLRWARDAGYLLPNIVPFGLFDQGRALSILNATRQTLVVEGTKRDAIQLGTVATDPDARCQGHAAELLHHVMAHYADLPVFLLANDEVVEFYPQFGFRPLGQTVFHIDLPRAERSPFRPLQPAVERDAAILKERCHRRSDLSSAFGVSNYANLAEWYCSKFFTDQLWYDDTRQILVVAALRQSVLTVYDVVIDRIVPEFFVELNWPGATRAICHFVPDRFEGDFTAAPDPSPDTHLFVDADFPAPEVIKIPELAHT